MADPFSVAAGTAGFVALGLKVCGGLVTYCKAWRTHDKEVEEALERLTGLDLTFKALDSILSAAEIQDDNTTDNFRAARDKIYSCITGMNGLRLMWIELESIGQPAGVLDKIHNVRLRSTALFNKEKLKGLNKSVKNIQLKLENAMKILSLQLALRQAVTLQELAKVQKYTADQIPKTIEQVLIKQLDLHGRGLCALKQDGLYPSSQHARMTKDLTHSISTLQLGMIQKPSLLESVIDEEHRMKSQPAFSQRRSLRPCTCRAIFKSTPYGHSSFYGVEKSLMPARWKATRFSSSLMHHRDCVRFHDYQEKKRFGLRISFSGPLLNVAIQAAMSMTRGFGRFSISPSLSFGSIVPSDTGPFKLFDIFFIRGDLSAANMRTFLEFQKQKLFRLYQEGKVSSHDVDEGGSTVMHKACKFFNPTGPYIRTEHSQRNEAFEIYFQFLRDLHEFGVPLNTMNAAGMTPLGELVTNINVVKVEDWDYQSLRVIIKMFDIGAELPLFTQEKARDAIFLGNVTLMLWFDDCQDLAEALGCNEISLAIIAKAEPWLIKAIRLYPESINQQNTLGQTPLHLSIRWPAGLQHLLEAGAHVDTFDLSGYNPIFYAVLLCLHEPFNLLAGTTCMFHRGQSESLLERVIQVAKGDYKRFRPNALKEEAEAIFDTTVRHVIERRRMLEDLVRTSLDAKAVDRLRLSTETILDRKASDAISMLRKKIEVPARLTNLTREHATVYHIPFLTSRQAQFLWNAGFREIDEVDKWGLSPLMSTSCSICIDEEYHKYWEFLVWLVRSGADLHRRQESAYNIEDDSSAYLHSKASGATALHYLAGHWARPLYLGRRREESIELFLCKVIAKSEQVRRVQEYVLTNATSDGCSCACSTMGCRPYTMLAKYPIIESAICSWMSITKARESALYVSQALVQFLDIDQPSLAWLRREIIRFCTFERLELRHTCCEMDHIGELETPKVMFEQYDDEEKVEINEEQAEQLQNLETLIVEFEDKYKESAFTFSEFLEGYWKDRMNEVRREEGPIDHEALEDIGVVLRKSARRSSLSSDHGVEEIFDEGVEEEPDDEIE